MCNIIEKIISNYDGDFQLLNKANNLTTTKQLIAQLSCDFDYHMNGYDKSRMQQHYFTGQYNVGIYTKKILAAQLGKIYFVPDTLKSLPEYKKLKKSFIHKHDYEPEIDELLTQTLELDEVLGSYHIHHHLSCYFMDNDFMDSINPNFTKVEIIGVDNFNCTINYHGSFYGDSSCLNMVEYGQTFMELSLLCSNQNIPFYKELLLDSYIHLEEKNYKMSAFIAFTAFESFVNDVSGREDVEERLVNKFKFAFKSKQVDGKNLNSYDSFTKLLNFYNDENLPEIRNNIAHGKIDFNFWQCNDGLQTACKFFVFSSLVIMCYEKSIKDFKNIDKYLCPIKESQMI
ncbi:hypothetical protein [Acinetobacter bereziniae]|uniref:hypothetical protein n=1 Tax=Acinetobacter bereziniae TaxID=106648 RepID=UPI0006651903|nr:hypothetical protein [Acinetobacter bereziniae]MBJ8428615.1 hypothetical protein [Acinetobacter bereziniae]MBJ8477634.1 hypothetical protein [Acinetobacter bereziniae]